MKNLKPILAICLLLAIVTSCTKEGPMGPAGPQGPQGGNGNPNIKSVEFTFDMATLSSSAPEYNLTCLTPNITPDVLDKGAVVGYRKSGSEWATLPTWLSLGSSIQINFRGHITAGEYRINIRRNDGLNVQKSDLNPPMYFKIVTIPGN